MSCLSGEQLVAGRPQDAANALAKFNCQLAETSKQEVRKIVDAAEAATENLRKLVFFDAGRKSSGTLIDELITTSMKCWHAQEVLADKQRTDAEVAAAGRLAQELNARRCALMRAIDERLGEAAASVTPKTYGADVKASTPRIVCICGSTRFVDKMAVDAWEFEKRGVIALCPHLLPSWYPGVKEHHQAEAEGVAHILDELHLRKIDMADEVFVVNENGYIGERTAIEIAYAEKHGKPVRYLVPRGDTETQSPFGESGRNQTKGTQ